MIHMAPDEQPGRYLVVGNPIAHSRSPEIHAAFAEQTGQRIAYTRRLIDTEPADAFTHEMRRFFTEEGGLGANVTLPFKEAACRLADVLSSRAEAAGAANTLSWVDGQIVADNTDGVGLVNDIEQRLKVALVGRRITVLGAGGAARGLMLPLAQAGADRLVVANRTLSRAQALAEDINRYLYAERIAVRVEAVSLSDAPCADILINATSAGLKDEGPGLPDTLFTGCRLAYDCIYADRPTPFLRRAVSAGVALCSDGLGMLVGQAAESFRIWRGVMPDVACVLARLRPDG